MTRRIRERRARRRWERAATFILIHTLLAGALLAYFRWSKLGVRVPSTEFWDHLLVAAGDWGLLLCIQTGWLLTVRSRWAGRFRSWPVLYLLLHLPLYIVSVTGERYFRETHNIQTGEMLVYMVDNLGSSGKVLTAGIDSYFITLSAVSALLLLSLVVVARKRCAVFGSAHIGVPALTLTLGLAGLFAPPPGLTAARVLAGNFATDLLPNPARAEELARKVPRWVQYEAPSLDPARVEAEAKRPDILLVLLESTRRDIFEAYGGDPALSPNLNAFIRDAAVVDDAYVGLSHTTKELVTIHCGMFPTFTMALPESHLGGLRMPCLPHLLADLGYDSAFYQSAGNFERRAILLMNLGYDAFFVPDQNTAAKSKQRGYLGYDESILQGPLTRRLRSPGSGPRLTTILSLTTHHPYMFKRSLPQDAQQVRESYRAAAGRVDATLGQLLLDLKNADKLEDTIVIVTGDHGEAFGDRPGFLQHDIVPYEEVTHVPLFVMGPGVPENVRVEGLRHHWDILPTLLRLAEVPTSGQLPGRDLFEQPGHPFVVSSCWYEANCASLRQGDLSFSYFYGAVPMEAYDLSRDPEQKRDIIQSIPIAVRRLARDRMLGAHHGSWDVFYDGDVPRRRRAPRRL